jgi:hypothetical protein
MAPLRCHSGIKEGKSLPTARPELLTVPKERTLFWQRTYHAEATDTLRTSSRDAGMLLCDTPCRLRTRPRRRREFTAVGLSSEGASFDQLAFKDLENARKQPPPFTCEHMKLSGIAAPFCANGEGKEKVTERIALVAAAFVG